MIVTGDGVAQFVSERIGAGLCPPYTTMGLVRGNELVSGVVFNQFEGFDVHVTIAGSHWTRRFIKAVGNYVYRQLGCLRMTVTTEQDQVAQYAIRLGGEVEGLLRNHFGPGRDGIVIGILREDFVCGRFAPDCSAADFFTRFPKEEANCESAKGS